MLGLLYSGIVKTAHAGFPKTFFNEWFTHGFQRAQEELEFRQSAAKSLDDIKAQAKTDPSYKKSGEMKKAEDAVKLDIAAHRKALAPKKQKKRMRHSELPRGSHLAMTAFIAGNPFIACAWADKTNKTSIGSTGHILPGKEIVRRTFKAIRHSIGYPSQEIRNRSFPIPSVFENLFLHLPRIDVHDHLRQGTLALEKSWATHSWSKRVFSTVLGVLSQPPITHHNHHQLHHSHIDDVCRCQSRMLTWHLVLNLATTPREKNYLFQTGFPSYLFNSSTTRLTLHHLHHLQADVPLVLLHL